METTELKDATIKAQAGNEYAREQMIRHYKPYVLSTVGHICKKYISWSDEEASIGLLALNKAIDTFDSAKGRTFVNYVYLLIKRDLIDFFRKENHEIHLFNNSQETENPYYEVEQSLQQFEKEKQASNLVEEILELSEELALYNIQFEELEKYSPKHKDTRTSLFEMAEHFIQEEECVSQFLGKKQFPTTLFVNKTGYKVKTVERHQKYLVTLILVKLNPQWHQLRQYINKGGS